MEKVGYLTDFIMITEPVLARGFLDEILTITEGLEWRVPDDRGYSRTCTTFPLSAAVAGGFPLRADRLELAKKADETLLAAVHKALRLYKDKFEVVTQSDSGFDILRYAKGQQIDSHADDLVPRVLSMSIGLNDDYTGGEFRFWQNENLTFRLPAGCALMFPPNFMYPHQILPVLSGTRYSMITWFL
jgi:hypothetical protein